MVSNYKDMIYLPVETSGEGEINAHSRVQMALGEAKNKARGTGVEALQQAGLTLQQCRDWVALHLENQVKPLYQVPTPRVTGLAANFVLHKALSG